MDGLSLHNLTTICRVFMEDKGIAIAVIGLTNAREDALVARLEFAGNNSFYEYSCRFVRLLTETTNNGPFTIHKSW